MQLNKKYYRMQVTVVDDPRMIQNYDENEWRRERVLSPCDLKVDATRNLLVIFAENNRTLDPPVALFWVDLVGAGTFSIFFLSIFRF